MTLSTALLQPPGNPATNAVLRDPPQNVTLASNGIRISDSTRSGQHHANRKRNEQNSFNACLAPFPEQKMRWTEFLQRMSCPISWTENTMNRIPATHVLPHFLNRKRDEQNSFSSCCAPFPEQKTQWAEFLQRMSCSISWTENAMNRIPSTHVLPHFLNRKRDEQNSFNACSAPFPEQKTRWTEFLQRMSCPICWTENEMNRIHSTNVLLHFLNRKRDEQNSFSSCSAPFPEQKFTNTTGSKRIFQLPCHSIINPDDPINHIRRY
jgi:hypothetical protein